MRKVKDKVEGKRLLLVIGIWLLVVATAGAQTSRFERLFLRSSGQPFTGLTVYLVPQANTYPTGALTCTPHSAQAGVYYRDAVPDGLYKLYYDHGTGPKLVTENFNVGVKVTTGRIDDGAVTLAKISASLKNYIDASGGGTVTNNPDDVTIVENDGNTLSLAPVLRDSIGAAFDTAAVHRNNMADLYAREINIKDFGALGDGQDNTTEFRAVRTHAASAGVKTIRINAGTYLLSDSVRLPSGIDWESTGGEVIIKLDDGTDGNMFVMNRVHDIKLSGLTFDWNYSEQSEWDTWGQGALVVDSSRNITITKCTIQNSVFGIFGHADTNLVIAYCTFKAMGTGGSVTLYSQVGVNISYNYIDNLGFTALGTYNPDPVIRLFESHGGNISFNKIWFQRTADNNASNEIGGIAVFPPSTVESSELTIIGNEIHGRGNELGLGITVVGYTGLNAANIAYNIIDSVGIIGGIELANRCNNVNITFNQIRNSPNTFGIAINAAADTASAITVLGNHIVNCNRGLMVQGNIEYSQIAFNHFQNILGTDDGWHAVIFNGKINQVDISRNTIRGCKGAGFAVNGRITNSSVTWNQVDSVDRFGYFNQPVTGTFTVAHNRLTRGQNTPDYFASNALLMFNSGLVPNSATTPSIAFDSTKGLVTNRSLGVKMFYGSITDGAPTASEVNTIIGMIPYDAGGGFEAWIQDTDGSGLIYRVVSNGSTAWYWDSMAVVP